MTHNAQKRFTQTQTWLTMLSNGSHKLKHDAQCPETVHTNSNMAHNAQ